jgi:hypothetical protein
LFSRSGMAMRGRCAKMTAKMSMMFTMAGRTCKVRWLTVGCHPPPGNYCYCRDDKYLSHRLDNHRHNSSRSVIPPARSLESQSATFATTAMARKTGLMTGTSRMALVAGVLAAMLACVAAQGKFPRTATSILPQDGAA